MIATSVASLAIVGLAGVLIDSHRRAWQRFIAGEDQALDAADGRARRYAQQMFSRRMAASSTLAVAGMLIAVRPLVPMQAGWMVVYLSLLVGSCLIVVVLGVADAVATSRYYRRSRRREVQTAQKLTEALEDARRGADES
ncbi:MAG: hypothetical protein AAGJ46_01910 [Planctomycetota bacterium]